jgi:hypothetical protein
MFLKQHSEHPGVKAALRFLDEWLEAGAEGRKVPAQRQAKRLKVHGVTALDLLLRIMAVWLYQVRRPNRVPDKGLILDLELAHAVLLCAPFTTKGPEILGRRTKINLGKPRPAERKELARWIRSTFAPLLDNAAHAMNETVRKKAERYRSLSEPFVVQ